MSKPQPTFNFDDLGLFREDKIRREVFSLENKRGALIRSAREKSDKTELERINAQILLVENDICYLQRELDVREKRKKAHEKFLQKNKNNRARGGRTVV